MKVLIACEFSGIVREAFKARGHDAWSCDLLETDIPGKHYKGDVLDFLDKAKWDLMIAHPPCTFLCNSGVRWLTDNPERQMKMEKAAHFFRIMLEADIPRIAVENPIMHKYAIEIIGRKHDQTIQPWQFGEDASKRTCLWLKGLSDLKPTDVIKKKRYANQTPSGQNKLGPSPDRWKERSKTYQGIASAMASQWGVL